MKIFSHRYDLCFACAFKHIHTYIRTNVFTIIGMQGAFRNWNVFKRCFSLKSKKIEENQFSAKPIKVESRQFHTNFSKHRNDFFTFKFYFLI